VLLHLAFGLLQTQREIGGPCSIFCQGLELIPFLILLLQLGVSSDPSDIFSFFFKG
jgi:hypothetical protein